MKALWFGLGMLALGIGLLAATITNIGWGRIVEPLRHISLPLLCAFLLVALLAVLVTAVRWRLILRAMGHRLGIGELYQYAIIGQGVSYLTPVGRVGGAPAKMLLLKRKGVPYSKGLASILLDNILDNSLDVIFACIIITFFLFNLPVAIPLRWRGAVIVGMALLLAFIFVFYWRMAKGKPYFSWLFDTLGLARISLLAHAKRTVLDIDRTMSWFIKQNPRQMLVIIAMQAAIWAILLTQYRLALLALGQGATLFELLMIMIALALVAIMPIPAAIGVLEFTQAGMFTLLGLDPSIGVAFALLIRTRDFLISTLGGGFLLQLGIGILTDHGRHR